MTPTRRWPFPSGCLLAVAVSIIIWLHWPMLIQVSKEHGGLLFTTDDFVRMSSFRTVEKRKAKAEARAA